MFFKISVLVLVRVIFYWSFLMVWRFFKKRVSPKKLRYHIDSVTSNYVAGWALDVRNPKKPCEVELRSKNKLLSVTKASALRQDLLDAGIGNGWHGFTVQLDMVPYSSEPREADIFINGKKVNVNPLVLKNTFDDVLKDFSVDVENRMDALLAIQNERMQREFDYLKKQLESGKR